ncbi:hypothetical protein GW932_04690 [archaeon]|nr:hypothetical protein [archaeon]
MKTLFVNALIKKEPDYGKIVLAINSLNENNFAICYSNQFSDIANEVSKRVEKKIVEKMQVLGCSNPKFSKETEAILFFGEGKFHSVSLAYESKLPTYIITQSSVEEVSKDEIEKMQKKEKGALLKYLMSEKIGILVTTKPGQNRLKRALEFKNKLKEKKGYIFIANDINTQEFENFDVDSFVNTACPRMDLNKGSIINLDKIPKEVIK